MAAERHVAMGRSMWCCDNVDFGYHHAASISAKNEAGFSGDVYRFNGLRIMLAFSNVIFMKMVRSVMGGTIFSSQR